MNRITISALALTLLAFGPLAACSDGSGDGGNGNGGGGDGGDGGDGGGDEPEGLGVLGWNSHSVDNVDLSVILDDDLTIPRDLGFNPVEEGELWVLGYENHMTIVENALESGSDVDVMRGTAQNGGKHFFAKPSAMSFADNGFFATAHEEDEITQSSTPADFMGPTLWDSDRDVFDAGHNGHMDMLHNTPNGVGIAWTSENSYWLYDGYHESLTLYHFHDDHGAGGSDHSDGEIFRYAEGEMGHVRGVPSHLEYEPASELLYIAHTAAGTIDILDTTVGETGRNISPNYDGVKQKIVNETDLSTFVDTAEAGITHPSGLALHEDHIWVSGNESGIIAAYNLDGELVDWLETGLPAGGLMGIEFGPDGALYMVDAESEAVLRLAPLEE